MAKKQPERQSPEANPEAEKSLLGILLKSNAQMPETVYATLEPEDFSSPNNQEIYREISRLFERREIISTDEIVKSLEVFGRLQAAGGKEYVAELTERTLVNSNTLFFAEVIRQCMIRRKLKEICEQTKQDTSTDKSPEKVLAETQYALSRLGKRAFSEKATRISAIAETNQESIEKQHGRGTMLVGLPTGFNRLNAMTLGYRKGDLIVIGGLPGMGKTAFALNLAEHLAAKNGYSVAFYSLESSKEQLGLRLQCISARVNIHRLMEGRLSREEKKYLFYSSLEARDSRMFIDDESQLSAEEIFGRALELKRQQNIDVVIIDHLGLLGGNGSQHQSSKKVGQIAKVLKDLARELDIPVILLSQLQNRRKQSLDREPRLTDLPGGGQLEQRADVVLFLHRPEYHDPETTERNVCYLILAKQRNGPTGEISIGWSGETTKFSDFIQSE